MYRSLGIRTWKDGLSTRFVKIWNSHAKNVSPWFLAWIVFFNWVANLNLILRWGCWRLTGGSIPRRRVWSLRDEIERVNVVVSGKARKLSISRVFHNREGCTVSDWSWMYLEHKFGLVLKERSLRRFCLSLGETNFERVVDEFLDIIERFIIASSMLASALRCWRLITNSKKRGQTNFVCKKSVKFDFVGNDE